MPKVSSYSRFIFDPFYMLNFLYFTSYLGLRFTNPVYYNSPDISLSEFTTYSSWFMISFVKYFSSETIDEWLVSSSNFGKLVVLVVSFSVDLYYGFFYLFVSAGMLLLNPKQTLSNDSSNIVYLTKGNLDEFLKNKEVLLCLYATWSKESVNFTPVFAQLSNATRSVIFAKIDVGRWPDIADRFKIETKNLPTLVLLKNGIEQKRIFRSPNTSFANEKEIFKHFNINK
ncbi:thioredoxin-related transmembrane protein [Acrasis kona]|uniref:Thioredoxin-related transmembrane protein n=1 Tax=Acrasis kona TaxID=1008807 RepID=A0AAW2YH79_9EUKA